MQLSLVELFPEFNRSLFLDVFAKMCFDARTKRPTLCTLAGQRVPAELKIRCQRKSIDLFPEGTVFKLDVRLVDSKNKKPYFSAIKNNRIQRAIEFYDHNLRLQNGVNPCPKTSAKAVDFQLNHLKSPLIVSGQAKRRHPAFQQLERAEQQPREEQVAHDGIEEKIAEEILLIKLQPRQVASTQASQSLRIEA